MVLPRINGEEHYKFVHYSNNNGLKQQFVNCIQQDNKGVLWLGTAEGMVRYDGVEFKSITFNDEVKNNYVSCIQKDEKGIIWFGNMKGEIYYIEDDILRRVKDTLETNVFKLMLMPQDEIWCVTQREGILRIVNKKEQSMVPHPFDNEVLQNIAYIAFGQFLISTDKGFYELSFNERDNTWHNIKKINLPLQEQVKGIVYNADYSKHAIVITESSVYKYEPSMSDLKQIEFKDAVVKNLNLSKLSSCSFNQQGQLLISIIGDGVIRIGLNDTVGRTKVEYFNESTGLEFRNIKSVFQDQNDNLWIGLYGDGLLRLINNQFAFYSYGRSMENASFSAVNARGQLLWAASKNVLMSIDAKSGELKATFDSENGVPNDIITALSQTHDGCLWIGTENRGLFMMDSALSGVCKVNIASNNRSENAINDIKADGNNLWVATKGGLLRYNLKSGQKKWLRSADAYIFGNIKNLFLDSRKRLFLGTKSKYVHYLDSTLTVRKLYPDVLNNYMILSGVAEDKNGDTWIATQGYGVIKVNDHGVYQYMHGSGLFSDYIYSIASLGNKMYMSHPGGISAVDIFNSKVQIMNREYGIDENIRFNMNAVTTVSNNGVWMGTSKGLLHIGMPSVNENLVDRLKLNMNTVKINGGAVNFKEQIVLPSGEYSVEFDFIGVMLSNPLKIKYRYKLEGYDDDWSELTTRRTALYNKLAHGQYTFQLKAVDEHENNYYLLHPIKISIAVPFYFKLWFLILIFLVFAGVVMLIIKIREKSLKNMQTNLMKRLDEKSKEVIVKEAIIEERKKIENELIEAKSKAEASDHFKATLLNNMSHEIRTPLNAIVGFSNLLSDDEISSNEMNHFIQLINKNSDYLLFLIEDIIELSNIQTGQLELNIQKCLVSEVVQEAYHRNIARTKTYHPETVDFLMDPLDDLENVYVYADHILFQQVLDKLLDNALKFTPKGYVRIAHIIRPSEVCVIIEDTGIGIAQNHYQQIFEAFKRVEGQKEVLYDGAGIGLSIVKMLCDIMNFEIAIHSELKKGSVFTITIPLIK